MEQHSRTVAFGGIWFRRNPRVDGGWEMELPDGRWAPPLLGSSSPTRDTTVGRAIVNYLNETYPQSVTLDNGDVWESVQIEDSWGFLVDDGSRWRLAGSTPHVFANVHFAEALKTLDRIQNSKEQAR